MVRKTNNKLKVKSLKGKSLKRSNFVEVGDGVVLPIITRSVSESATIKYEGGVQIPTKLRTATKEEMDGILQHHPRYNGKSIPLVQEFDIASKEFLDERKNEEQLTNIIEIIKFVDMDYLIESEVEGEEDITLWEDMGIPKGDWTKAAQYFTDSKDGLGMTEKDMENLFIAVKELQGESIFTTIKKLESLSGKGMFEILALIEKVETEEKEMAEDEAI